MPSDQHVRCEISQYEYVIRHQVIRLTPRVSQALEVRPRLRVRASCSLRVDRCGRRSHPSCGWPGRAVSRGVSRECREECRERCRKVSIDTLTPLTTEAHLVTLKQCRECREMSRSVEEMSRKCQNVSKCVEKCRTRAQGSVTIRTVIVKNVRGPYQLHRGCRGE